MGAQVGIYSAYQLGIHGHLNNDDGGILNEYSRDGAFMEAYRTGALAVHVDNDAEVLTGLDGYILLKQFSVNTAERGEFRFTWQSRTNWAGQPIWTQFYVNGVAVGAEDTHAFEAYQNVLHNYDVNLAAGDLLQIYGKATMGASLFVRNFRIYYDWALKYFGNAEKTLTAPLALTNADLLDVTADF